MWYSVYVVVSRIVAIMFSEAVGVTKTVSLIVRVSTAVVERKIVVSSFIARVVTIVSVANTEMNVAVACSVLYPSRLVQKLPKPSWKMTELASATRSIAFIVLEADERIDTLLESEEALEVEGREEGASDTEAVELALGVEDTDLEVLM